MSTPASSPAIAQAQQISSPARLLTVFYAPSRTFEDIARAPHFLLCCVVQVGIGWVGIIYTIHRLGILNMARQSLLQNATGRALSPAQLDQQARAVSQYMKIPLYTSPVFSLAMLLIYAGIFYGAVNFIFGRQAKFKQVFSVIAHAMLPLALFYLVSMVVLRFSDPANVQFTNILGSNPAFFFDQASTPPALYALLSHLDVFAIWCVVLISIGLTKLGKGIKFGSTFSLTAGLWLLFVLASAGVAAI